MEQRWWLDDAEARNAAAPRSFFIPSQSRREAVAPGQAVKLIFLFEPTTPNGTNGERMWVEVRSAMEGRYLGKLLNQPAHIDSLKPGDALSFESKHIAAIQVSEEELGYAVDDYAAVGQRVRDDDEFPQLVARVALDARQSDSDSGWRLAAAEDDGPPDWWDLGWITDKFPEVEALLRLDVEAGSWRWNGEARSYVAN